VGLGMSGVCIGKPIDRSSKRMSKVQVRFSGNAEGEVGQGCF
jgi:hypothetical protein